MGSVHPSSRCLARAIAREVDYRPGTLVIELGGGTGAISRGLLTAGVPADGLVVVERDPKLHAFLTRDLPDVRVINADATKLTEILERFGDPEISAVVSGLPMVNMPISFQKGIYHESFRAMNGEGAVIQYSYSPISPVRAKALEARATLKRYVMRNLPPATVWRVEPLVRDDWKQR